MTTPKSTEPLKFEVVGEVGPLPSEKVFEEQLQFHRYAASFWAVIANDAREKLKDDSWYNHRLTTLEPFMVRCLDRAMRHYREAEGIRERGYTRKPVARTS